MTHEQKVESIHLSELSNGDEDWEARIIACSQNPDDPPILPGWNLRPCEEFYLKAVAYGGAGGAMLPPIQLFGGAHPGGPVTADDIQQMQLGIVEFLASTNPGSSVIGGANGSVGLACTGLQFGIACGQLRGLELNPWFSAVLKHGAALSGTLASIYVPHPPVSSGLYDMLPFDCILWG